MIEINILGPDLEIEDKSERENKEQHEEVKVHSKRLRLQMININGEIVDVES